jgi:hypothetical protein
MTQPDKEPDALSSRTIQGAGGTPGGLGSFLLGLGLVVVGGYLILNHIVVHTHFSIWGFPGTAGGGFGPLLIALMVGVGILFFNAKNAVGWLITVGAVLTILVSVVMNLELFFQPTTLLMTLVMFLLVAAGLGLIFKSFRALPSDA